MAYEHELTAAREAAARAGQLILEHYARLQAIPDAPASITTETDHLSQEAILQHLHQAFPSDALRAEERTATLGQVPDSGPRLWVVDPIDGTRGFARKNGEFSVMVALVENDRIAVGVVLEPAKDRLTYASSGGGCWRVDGGGKPERCHVSTVRRLEESTIVQSHSKPGKPPSAALQSLRPARTIETYSAGVKLAIVARGEADIYLNTYDAARDWDICAGQILVDEAGGRVTNFRGESPRYGQPGAIHHGGLLASNGVLHDQALARLQ